MKYAITIIKLKPCKKGAYAPSIAARGSAGSGHSVKAKPWRAATRALTVMSLLPAMNTRGRRTEMPPAGAQSEDVCIERQKAGQGNRMKSYNMLK